MKIISFKNKISNEYNTINEKDENDREIGYSIIKQAVLTGRNNYYPNVLLYSKESFTSSLEIDTVFSPYDEKIMSLNKNTFYDNNDYNYEYKKSLNKIQIFEPVFFFIYNFDNYYHYIYDTIPYLYTYLYLKKIIPTIKLLVNYPNPNRNEFYKFNIDILEKIVNKQDILLHNNNNVYENIYISTSLTHGGLSNNPPRTEIYELYNRIIKCCNYVLPYDANIMNANVVEAHRTECLSSLKNNKNNKKYIYISRRTWINNDNSNIGTDYTTRRKMMNEDLLVEELSKLGIHEIFTENLSIDEKISLFNNAELIVGSIGGGMSNLLFAKSTTKTIVIVTPHFLDINSRFKYSMEKTDIQYFNDVSTYCDKNTIPLYCRCKINKQHNKDKIGEIINWKLIDNKEKYLINISKNDVAGFNNTIIFENEWFDSTDFELLDNGLNSPYEVDVNKLINRIKNTMNTISII